MNLSYSLDKIKAKVVVANILVLLLSACSGMQPTEYADNAKNLPDAQASVTAVAPLGIPLGSVSLLESRGQARISSAEANTSFLPLSAYFETQKNQAFCAVASSVIILNALNIQRPKNRFYPDFPYFNQDEFFNSIDPKLANPETVSKEGMTFEQLAAVLRQFPVSVSAYRGDTLSVDKFRETIRSALSSKDQFALLNFFRPSIGEVGVGHWSPLAAFDAKSDSVLVLDVARYKYPPLWVPVTKLYEGAQKVDNTSGVARGLLVIQKQAGIN